MDEELGRLFRAILGLCIIFIVYPIALILGANVLMESAGLALSIPLTFTSWVAMLVIISVIKGKFHKMFEKGYYDKE